MGVLVYDGEAFEFEDRVLAHLQAVVTVKLRRREPFLLSWSSTEGERTVRNSVWIDNAIPLRYELHTEALGRLDQAWIDELMEMTARASGVVLAAEPDSRRPRAGGRRKPQLAAS